MDFDETRLYYSHQQLQNTATTSTTANVNLFVLEEEDASQQQPPAEDDDTPALSVPTAAMRRHFREFFRT